MTTRPARGVVVDTIVVSWLLDDRPNPLADQYRTLIGMSPIVVAFQSVMEVRYGALRADWGDLRRRRLDRSIAEFTAAQPDNATINACAQLRASCHQQGHPLANKVHDGDRWIAATAIRLGLALVSHDHVFTDAPGLQLLRTTTP